MHLLLLERRPPQGSGPTAAPALQKLQRLICRRAGAGGGIGSLCSEQRVRMADLSLCAFCALCEQQPRSASRIVLGLK